MKLSESWLREWVSISFDAQELASRLTMAGLEVESISPAASAFEGVIVAQVLTTTSHPQADKLTLCEVEIGNGLPLKIVCGAANVRAGLKVALAQVGAKLPNGLVIKEAKLRGELSQGMLCSVSELGLAETSEGIMELEENAPLGVDLREYLALNDFVLDIDLTPNRADCFSVLGVAREIAALTRQPLKEIPKQVNQPSIDESLSIELQAPEACPQYCGRIIRGINANAQTPVWISERLRRAGLRIIHPVVDVTNYVMLELGQPMHAFDLKTIDSSVQVRFAKEGEKLKLLDGQEVRLTPTVLIIADQKKPLALAGVMGGQESSVQELTQDIFLESAFFNPLTIAGVARSFGLTSDSSQRFERGVDPNLQILALERATSLLLEIVGGQAGPIASQSLTTYLPQKKKIVFHPRKVKQVTGLVVEEQEMAELFQSLGLTVEKNQSSWQLTAPSHRFDLCIEVDLVEEISRLYGYDKMLAEKMPAPLQAGHINPYEELSLIACEFFRSRGYNETISYSFVDPEFQKALYPDKETMKLLNPISSELSEMRVGMWPGLLASMVYNAHRQQNSIKFFEQGVIFDLENSQLNEHACIAGLVAGEKGALNWSEKSGKFDFYDLKGDLESFFSLLRLKNLSFVSAEHSALHPGKSAKILIDGQQAGWCGVLHPRINDAFDFSDEIMLFELNLKSLIVKTAPRYQTISKFPQIRRDLSMLVDNEVTVAQIEILVRNLVSAEKLKAFDVFDLYSGESIPQGKKSLAIALTLQDNERTMVDNEINEIINAIIKKLNEEFSIQLRD